ncbi:MAG: hypothetical protein LLF76_14995 [Planctomycetaceae bacterium]|nr:hypothetical protein [Planctomycetaceae bacterium]
MKKIQILLLIAAGISSFAGAFAGNWYMKQKKAQAFARQAQAAQAEKAALAAASGAIESMPFGQSPDSEEFGMSERQLQNLIHDIRQKLLEYHDRDKQLQAESGRIEMARQALQQDIEQLSGLREKLNLTLSQVQEQEKALRQSVLEIDALERSNFQRLASTYEKMEVTQAGRIMVTMAASNQLQDSVKILYYMSDRSAGKLLAEIATVKPELATVICSHLKRIKENG